MNKQQRLNESYICKYIHGTPNVLYDIGVGPKSEWKTLGTTYPQMTICGCEPHPKQFQSLLQAGFPGRLEKVAISEMGGTATFFMRKSTMDSSFFSRNPEWESNSHRIEVDVWTLDHFDMVMGKPDRILLWMDIEGSELSALRGGCRLLDSGRVLWINLEERRRGYPIPGGWCNPKELHTFLNNHNYLRKVTYNHHQKHQDVIYIHHTELGLLK